MIEYVKHELHDYIFDWDKDKNLLNIEKHGISFKEAATAFLDPNAALMDDQEHSQEEDRFKIIGHSEKLNLLMVCHCYKEDGMIIRIISARKATKTEEGFYGGAK